MPSHQPSRMNVLHTQQLCRPPPPCCTLSCFKVCVAAQYLSFMYSQPLLKLWGHTSLSPTANVDVYLLVKENKVKENSVHCPFSHVGKTQFFLVTDFFPLSLSWLSSRTLLVFPMWRFLPSTSEYKPRLSPELLTNQLQIVSFEDPCLGLRVTQNQTGLLMFTS